MPVASAIGSSEVGHSQLERPGKFFCQFAFPLSRPCYHDRSEHPGLCRHIIDMPSQRFDLFAMAFEPRREVPLGTSHVEIESLSEEKPSELTHGNVSGFGQVENRDVYSAIQSYDESFETVC